MEPRPKSGPNDLTGVPAGPEDRDPWGERGRGRGRARTSTRPCMMRNSMTTVKCIFAVAGRKRFRNAEMVSAPPKILRAIETRRFEMRLSLGSLH